MSLDPVCVETTKAVTAGALGIISTLAATALTISAFVAAAGLIAGPTMGALYIGLGGGSALAMCMVRGLNPATEPSNKKRSIVAIALMGALWCAIGALGVTGLMTGTQLGWVLTGITIGIIGLAILATPCICYAGYRTELSRG